MKKKGGMLGFRTSSALQTDKARWFAIIRGFHVSRHMITHESHTLLTWTQFPIQSLLPRASLYSIGLSSIHICLLWDWDQRPPSRNLACRHTRRLCMHTYSYYTNNYSTSDTLRVRHAPSTPRAALSTQCHSQSNRTPNQSLTIEFRISPGWAGELYIQFVKLFVCQNMNNLLLCEKVNIKTLKTDVTSELHKLLN